MNEASDADLISMMNNPASKDKGFLQLMDTYKRPVYWHIRRLVISHQDAEDIMQETFINVYRFSGSFKGESRIFTWIYRIATNECIKHFRKNSKRLKNTGTLTDLIAGDLSESDAEHSDAMLVKLQQAILLLPEKQRIVFNLRYYDELSYQDIAQIINSSVNTLKTNYHFASEKVRKYLIEHA